MCHKLFIRYDLTINTGFTYKFIFDGPCGDLNSMPQLWTGYQATVLPSEQWNTDLVCFHLTKQKGYQEVIGFYIK